MIKHTIKTAVLIIAFSVAALYAVEISLDALTPIRVGYIDMQKVFDVFPEKAFAEGDLLREIEKRKLVLAKRQANINILRQQIAADQVAVDDARAGRPVVVPHNALEPVSQSQGLPVASHATSTPVSSGTAISTSTVQPYPTEEPLSNLLNQSTGTATAAQTPSNVISDPLEALAVSSAPVTLDPGLIAQLDKRIKDNRRSLDQSILSFRDYRSKSLEDMKILQKEKTYDVMSKIYAVLESLARDESITVVLDKSYVLYGEDSIDLTDKLIQRLQQQTP
jgi:Skp family chaperone for outer membrane proteins